MLLDRDAYHNTGSYWKGQPFFVGPALLCRPILRVKKINENAYELNLPIIFKKHPVFNVKRHKSLSYEKGGSANSHQSQSMSASKNCKTLQQQ